MKTLLATLCLTIACLGAGPLPLARAQEASSEVFPKRSELVLRYYTAKRSNSTALSNVAAELLGETVKVSTADGGWVMAPRFLVLGTTIIVQETPKAAETILQTLSDLDLKTNPQEVAPGRFERLEIVPRHITVESLMRGMSLQRSIELMPVQEKRVLIVSGPADRMDDARSLIAALDVPAPQVTITCHLIRGMASGTSSPSLPSELVENLGRLLPMPAFELLSVGVLHTAVANSPVELDTVAGPELGYGLQLEPSAYDEKEGTLTLASCRFQLRVGHTNPAQPVPPMIHELRTSLSLRAGEYTVLGALGPDPTFVVLRVMPDRP